MKMDIWRVIMIVATLSLEWCSASVLPLHRVVPPNHVVGMKKQIAREQARQNGTIADFDVHGRGDIRPILYYTTIALGSPSQTFNVLLDSASDITWVSCSSCSNCPPSNYAGIKLNFYNIATSTTGTELPSSDQWCDKKSSDCGYSISYVDGSNTSGHLVRDVLRLNPIAKTRSVSSSVPFKFGCSTSQYGQYAFPYFGIDGILGLSPGEHSIISQLSSQGFIPRVFSLCLKGDGNGSGKLILGSVVHPNMTYIPLVRSKSHYQLSLEKIVVNGNPLPIDPSIFTKKQKGTILDSGSAMAYLIPEAYDPLVEVINNFISEHATIQASDERVCYQPNNRGLEIFPLVSLSFAGGSSIDFKPKDYLLQEPTDPPRWCLGFLKSQDGYGFSVLGAIVLRDKMLVHDLYQQRLGLVDHDCSSSSYTVNQTYGFDKGGQRKSSRTTLGNLISMLIFCIITIVQ